MGKVFLGTGLCYQLLPLSGREGFLFVYIFFLVFINRTRGFHCDNSIDVYSVLWTSSHPLLYSSNLPPSPHSFLNSAWWVSLCYLYVCVCLCVYTCIYVCMYIHTCIHIHKKHTSIPSSQVPSSFSFPTTDPPPASPPLHSVPLLLMSSSSSSFYI
jgi:hypothetical protein